MRLPVRWSAHAAAEPPYTIDPDFFARVDWAIDQATSQGLGIVVDVHHYEEMSKAPADHLPRLEGLWRQIASRYQNRGDNVYFELFNEPHGQFDAASWNAAIPRLLAAIRETNPTRPVVVGPVDWNSVRGLDSLQLPEEDRHLIVTVHFYDPFHFTHQGAEWVEGAGEWLGQTWPNDEADKNAVRSGLENAARWGRDHKRPVYLGEFGAYSKAHEDSRNRWTRFVAEESDRLGMSRAYWEFCGGFGIYDPQEKTWREPLKSATLAVAPRD